jgi:hypothetical protein
VERHFYPLTVVSVMPSVRTLLDVGMSSTVVWSSCITGLPNGVLTDDITETTNGVLTHDITETSNGVLTDGITETSNSDLYFSDAIC